MLAMFSGYKTYLVVAAGIILYGAEAMGVLPASTVEKVEDLLVLLGFGALRSGIAKSGK